MTEDPTEPAKARSGRARRWIIAGLLVLSVLVFLPAGAMWVRLYAAPMSLPEAIQDRIEARINASMRAGDLAIGDMVLALPQGGRAPALEFRDVELRTPEGEVRAALPALRARVAPGPLLRGRMEVRRVVITGAGVNLTRSEDGRIDLDFAGAADAQAEAAELSLVETLARLDTMFSGAVFSGLEEVRGEALEVQLSDELSGQVLRLHGAEMRLVRAGLRLNLDMAGELEGSRNARLRITLDRDRRLGVTELGMEFDTLAARDLAASTPALAWLDLMRAPIDGALRAAMADDGTIGAVEGWIDVGAGVLSLPGQAAPLAFQRIEAALDYDPNTGRAMFERLMLRADALTFAGHGHADVSPEGDVFTGQFSLSDITADPEGMFDAAVALDGAEVDLRLHLGDAVMLEVGQAVLFRGDMRATARGRMQADAAGLALSVDAQLDEADLPTIMSYWPVAAIPNTRWWVQERLIAARASGVDFAFRQAAGARPHHELSFDFNGADIRALPAAPPIRGASGYLNLIDTQLVVGLDGGGVGVEGQGQVGLAGSRMVIENVAVPGPLAVFDLELQGALPDLMHVLAGPPFAVLETSGFAPDEIGQGRVRATAELATHLVDRPPDAGMGDLDIRVDAIVTNYRGSELVPDRLLTADRIVVAMDNEALTIGGPAELDGVSVTGQWRVAMAPDAPPGSQVRARATLSRDALARFGVELPAWLISGRGEADVIVYLRANGPASVSVSSDLDGIALAIPALAWSMPAGRTGAFSADIRLGDRPAVSNLVLEGAGLSLEGAVSFTEDGWLNRLSAGRFRVGQWLDVQGGLIGRRNQTPGIEISSGILDFRTMPSLANTGGSSGDVGPLNIALDRLQITGGIALTDLRADLDGASMSGNFRGRVNGAAAVSGQLVPSANGPSVRLQSADGGAVLRAADIFENMHGGQFDLILAARPEAGQYDGRVTIDGPRMRNAPVMAELLNLISVVGLLEQLGGEGINMGEVEARFRITPQRLFLEEGTAVGPSMGISMDGVYDVASERFEVQGVVSPLYLVNGVLGALFAPRREGLFGFNYRAIYDGSETSVSVNPLSILTPGIFREIFRAPPPDFGDGDG
ncbi:hypothetical protein [Hasllibacter sp. MH4015]|uniref:hypothetical protein n=1 Tax=Hasllibacter sp. MH4015 TaxID=2854029 RepID=UPI001CD1E953|nr:hypothetical protein [Hasllibacter sp. MH4015]